MKMLKLAFAICLLAGASLALQWEGSSTSNERYDGGSAYPDCQGSTPIDFFANMAHMLTVNATLTQNGIEPTEFSSGPADLTMRATTSASIARIVSTSTTNESLSAQPSPVQANLVFNSPEYAYISGKYGDVTCLSKNPARGATDRGIYYLNSYYGSRQCDHAMVAADAVTVNVGYDSGVENDGCMTGPYYGMGKGYMYCKGSTVSVNGQNVGTLSSNGQTFSTKINLATGVTSIPVSVKYQCYFVVELYLNNGQKQSLQDMIYVRPGNVPITQTVNIPINRVNPPQINLVPFITLNNTNYYTGTHVTVNKVNTNFDISFFVNRTDNLTLIETPYLNWSITSTPPELITRTYRDFKLVPPLTVGTPSPLVPPGTTPPATIRVCRPGIDTDYVTLEVNPGHSIVESDYSDDSITITFDCSGLDNPMCRFNPSTMTTYPGQTKMTNMSCYDKRTMEPIDCPMWSDASIIHSNGEFSSHYLPLAWAYDSSENATNLANVTAIMSTNPDAGPYSDTVTATFPGSYIEPFRCSFNLEWGRPDCRYYM